MASALRILTLFQPVMPFALFSVVVRMLGHVVPELKVFISSTILLFHIVLLQFISSLMGINLVRYFG